MSEASERKPPGTTRRVPKTGAHAAVPRPASQVLKGRQTTKMRPQAEEPRGHVEVVTSGEATEVTRVRRSVSAASHLRGLSLRWKIMIAMAGVTVTAAILIFFVVYTRAVRQLDAEIDAKGQRLIYTLASVDGDYWLAAMYQNQQELTNKFDDLVRKWNPDWEPTAKGTLFAGNPSLKEEYDRLFGRLGTPRYLMSQQVMRTLKDQIKRTMSGAQPDQLESRFERVFNDPSFQLSLQELMDPFTERLMPLKAAGIDLRQGGDIVQMSVQDLGLGAEPQASVQVEDVQMGLLFDRSTAKRVGELQIVDGTAVVKPHGKPEMRIPSRSFTYDRKTQDQKRSLRFYVLLSLDHINQSKGELRTMIFLTSMLSVIVALVIAWLISTRITEPVKILMSDIEQVSQGDLDHTTRAHSGDEIGMLADTFNRMTSALKAAHEQEMEAKALEHELDIAAEIQANLVPKKMLKLDGYDISAFYRPSKEVGGDYYDFIEIDDQHSGLIVADVSGKGIPGSLVMSMTRALTRMEAERSRNTSPSNTLVYVNRMLAQDIKKGMFVTAQYCILEQRTRRLAVTSAGHNPMIVWRAATKKIELINPKGIALGFDKGPVFERTISEEVVQLAAGDRIVMYTDGTVEAMNAANEEFGDDRFNALVAQLATRDSNQFLNILVKALDDHKGDAPQHDDMTIVTLRCV